MANSGEMRFGGTRGGGVPRRRAAGVGCLLFRYGGSAGNGRRRGDGRDDHTGVFSKVFRCARVRSISARLPYSWYGTAVRVDRTVQPQARYGRRVGLA